MSCGGMSSTPVSEAMMTRPSLVTQKREDAAIAVEDRADLLAVGEGDGGGRPTVP